MSSGERFSLRRLRKAATDADHPLTLVWFALALSSAYFCVYFWRYVVFVVPNAPDVPLGKKGADGSPAPSVSLKTLLSVGQTLGFLAAKFPAIKIVTGFNRRYRFVLLSVLCASGALLVGFGFGLFAEVDGGVGSAGPWLQTLCVFLAAMPSSWIWGVVVTYTEGRRSTEILLSAMSVLLVFAGGAARATGAWAAEAFFDNEYAGARWVPLIVGGGMLIPSLLLFKLVDAAPPPSNTDVRLKAARASMSMRQAWALFVQIWPGIVTVIIGYASLTALRAFRDFFATEIYTAVLGKEPPAVFYLVADLPAAIVTALALSFLRTVVDNRRATLLMCGLMLLGTVILFVSAMMQDENIVGKPESRSQSDFAGYMWAITVGVGIYMSYLPQGAMLYDRIIAARRDIGTGVFLVFASDLAGYVGSVSLLFYNADKEVKASQAADDTSAAQENDQFLRFFVTVCYSLAALNAVVFGLSTLYWWKTLPTDYHTLVEEDPDDDMGSGSSSGGESPRDFASLESDRETASSGSRSPQTPLLDDEH